jgi:hypothetical protein
MRIDPKGDDKYGHWWFVIGDFRDVDSESYGWWPERSPSTAETLIGIRGDLNGQKNFRGNPTRDPHHKNCGDLVEEFHPFVAASDPRTDAQIADCLRTFAQSCVGEWRWTFGSGLNCHSFQEKAMRHCGLHEQIS